MFHHTRDDNEGVSSTNSVEKGKLKKRANLFRKLITGEEGSDRDVGSTGGRKDEGLISRLPDDLLLESLVGDAGVLDGVVTDVETEEMAHIGQDGADLDSESNEWYSSSKVNRSHKSRRRHKRTAFHRGEEVIGETEIYLRILHQCLNDTVQEIQRAYELSKRRDPNVDDESALDSIIDDVVQSVLFMDNPVMEEVADG
jgi:hypothetical protein